MIDAINNNIKNWDWKSQVVWEEKFSIPNLINKIEQGYYKTKIVKLNLEVYNLRVDNFKCETLFEFLTHYKLVDKANLKYPVIINQEGQVVDGRHRVCKAILKWMKEINAIQILDSTII